MKPIKQRLQIRMHLLRESTWKKPQTLTRFNGRTGQDNPLHPTLLECLYGTRNGNKRLPGTGRAEAENDVVLVNSLQVLGLPRSLW
jgi:hypothetical protein